MPMRLLAVILAVIFFAPAVMAREGVVLLHGLCRTKASMKKMEKALTESGFVVENIDYESRGHPVKKLSEQVIGNALKKPRLRDCTKIHFVTHSLGGVLVRCYLKHHKIDRLGRVVMLAPPNQGSEVVDKIGSWRTFKKINGPAGAELGTHPDSVPNQLGPVDFECGVIAGSRSINGVNSLMIDGADDGKVSIKRTRVKGMKEHVVVPTSHPYIMKNRDVIEKTTRFLQTGTFVKKPARPAAKK